MEKSNNKPQRRGIYLLPNVLTTAGLFAGFYAVIASMNGDFVPASVAIFIAMIMDGLDGRIARMTNTQTDFGAEYDSMADMISFGLAPALVCYNWSLATAGKLGWLAAFVFVACAALRLARFNTQVGTADKRYFQGLPSPSAAAILAGMVWLGSDLEISGHAYSWIAAFIVMAAGLLMVSNFRYSSFKEFDWRGKVPFIMVLVVVLIFILIAAEPPIVLFSTFTLYALSGPALTAWRLNSIRSERRSRRRAKGQEGDDS